MFFYQCQKCLEKFNGKTDIQRHLNRKNKCFKDRSNLSFDKLTYQETSLLKRNSNGLVENIKNKNFECEFCKKKIFFK